ncbi:hypothetical protein Poli38472_006100 [Pythium oligandrum]|uniref:Golgi SNAP receptor complex member 1 n=1 Tax=Pythium oligandrum TaxID=41045 RepID=A0A8K1CRR2_PYTOL|nr:hypothetical protein Poli38472_006100 [Pythium oligandrum]|eukprot:TMW68632.1 hypothetical protein Poli38472_006100 [Pythium oligandrum]
MMTAAWDELRRKARAAEHTLEEKIAAYVAINREVKRSTTQFDEENPPTEGTDEKQLSLEIENALMALSDAIDEMNAHVNTSASKTQEAVLQRYRELYFDFKTEFQRTMSSLQEKRESQRLFGNRQKGTTEDNETDALLNERRAVDSSRLMTNSIIEQALETKNSLENQRSRFMSSRGKANTIANSFTGINSLMEQIRRKKMRNNTILALVIAGCVCFTLWWTILSKT